MTKTHVVKQGETLASIAQKYGRNWRSIYEHPQNARFLATRPNPNIIYPGDQLFIPDKELKEVDAATEQLHVFKLVRPKQILRIAVEDKDKRRIANANYELVVDDCPYQGTTDGAGMLEERIPIGAQQGRLTVGTLFWVIQIAHLNPLRPETNDQGVSGAQGRLLNLGYDVGRVDGILGPKTKAVLKQFQADESLEVTGALDYPTQAKLTEKHGC